MSKSAYLEEDSSWAQTFMTVTPQDDGFLREIEDTAIVSGNAAVPLNLETWNIVLRRSLLNTTKDFIDSKELEKSERIATETQTYLQGVPRVDLPLVYRDEATQTLYIGKDEKCKFEKAFDDIITVMNEKPLPKWKKSQYVQTMITFESVASLVDIIGDLETNSSEADFEKSDPMISAGVIESLDALNFLVDRALWMSEPVPISKTETKEAEVETMLKYNHALKKLTIDHEVQTDLTCDPKFSNSMLVSGYNGTKDISRETVGSDLEKIDSEIETRDFSRKSVESEKNEREIEIEDFVRKTIESNLEKNDSENETKNFVRITENSDTETKDFRKETIRTSLEMDSSLRHSRITTGIHNNYEPKFRTRSRWEHENQLMSSHRLPSPISSMRPYLVPSPSKQWEEQKTENILLTNIQSYVSRNREEAAQDPNLEPACLSRKSIRKKSSSESVSSNSHVSYKRSLSSLRSKTSSKMPVKYGQNLPAGDEQALKLLKDTFCTRNRPEEPLPKRGACRCPKEREELLLPNEIR